MNSNTSLYRAFTALADLITAGAQASVVTTLSLDNLDEGYEEIIYEYLGNTNSSNNHDCGVVTVM